MQGSINSELDKRSKDDEDVYSPANRLRSGTRKTQPARATGYDWNSDSQGLI